MRQLWARMCDSEQRAWWPLAASTCLILLAVVPWRSAQDHSHWARVQWVPFASPPVKASDIIGNVLLYLPFGFTAARRRGRLGLAVALGAALALSVFTEFTQVYSHGRFPSSGDVTCNLLGAWLGARLRPWRRGRTLTPPGAGSKAEGVALH